MENYTPSALDRNSHKYWMELALREAAKAMELSEVPIGALIVFENRIIGRGFNSREHLQDPTAHAEILAITAAASHLESWRLTGCTLYVTLEPCPMCAGAILNARIPRLVFGADDLDYGACGGKVQLCSGQYLNHKVEILGGIEEDKCQGILDEFFRLQRQRHSQPEF